MKFIKIKLISVILFIIFIVGCNGSGWQAISYSDPPSSGGLFGNGLILNQQELDIRGYVAELYFSDPIDIQGQLDGNWVSVTTTNLGLPQMNPNALITFTNSDNAAISFTAAWDPNTLTDDDSAAPALKIYAPCTIPTGTYTIAFNTSGVRRHSDQAMDGSTYSVIFKVVNPNTDTQNPYITYTFPQNGSALFNPHGTLILQFSKPLGNLLGSSTPDMNNLSLSSPDNQNLTASIANGLNIGTTYTITIVSNTGNALIDYMPYTQDVDGNALTGTDGAGIAQDYVWTFTTSGIRISASSPSDLNYTNANAVLSFSGSALTTVTGITIGGNIPNGVATYISSDGSFTTSSFRFYDGQGYTVSVCATISSGYDGGCDTIVVSAYSGAPTNLYATGGNNYITLQWQASTESNVAGYNVYRGTSSLGPYQQIATDVSSLEYNDASVVTNTTYYYVVTTIDGSGNESGYSNEVSAYAGMCASPTYVSGNISTNTRWKLCGSPYIVTGNLYVQGSSSNNPAILTIDPGVVVEFSGTSLNIGSSSSQPGELLAMGDPDHPITFTGSTSGQVWQGITFNYATANTAIANSIVEGSSSYGLNLNYSSILITALRVNEWVNSECESV